MAHIINLASEITGIRRRFGEIHASVLGFSVDRTASVVRRRLATFYSERACELARLEDRLVALKNDVERVGSSELTKRAREQIRTGLLAYTDCLLQAVSHLRKICENLRLNEAEYRQFADDGKSRFQHDKITYEYMLQDLDHWGAKLDSLFSSY